MLAVGQGARAYSITQVRAYRECPAKWWYTWVLGHKPAPTEALTRGSDAHALLADYYRGGEKCAGPLSAACDPAFIPEDGRVWVEQKFSVSGPEHTLVVGVADLVVRYASGEWLVVDHKTTSARTLPNELTAYDMVQLGVYARVLFQAIKGLESVTVAHNVVNLSTGKRTLLTRELTAERCDHIWHEFCRTISEMEKVREPVRNYDSCRNWGGCGVMGVCTADRLIKVGECAKSDH